MSHAGDEAFLVGAAETALPGQEVLAAGIFSWQELSKAMVVGTVGGSMGAEALTGSGMAGAVGAGVGAHMATEAMAKANGMTVGLLVAVTAAQIHVFNWEDAAAAEHVRLFDRATTAVQVTKFGLSRHVQLQDSASGQELLLHASVSPISVTSKPDKVVLHLLAE